MADHQESSVTLPSEPASVPTARRHVADVLTGWGLDDGGDTADAIRLIVSELATNAVLHTFGQSPNFTVDVRLVREELLHIGVTDSHPRRPRRLPAAVQQDNGRGLVIIRSRRPPLRHPDRGRRQDGVDHPSLDGGARTQPLGSPEAGQPAWSSCEGHAPFAKWQAQ